MLAAGSSVNSSLTFAILTLWQEVLGLPYAGFSQAIRARANAGSVEGLPYLPMPARSSTRR